MDEPGPRRVNVVPVARLGGPALFIAFAASTLPFHRETGNLPAILAGALIIVLAGVADDFFGVSAFVKLAAQTAAAALVYMFGVRISYVTNPAETGAMIYLPAAVSFVVTVVWLVGITNTLNFIDGLDGLAAGVTCIASLTLFLAALERGQPDIAYCTMSLTGLSAGFLRWNFYPAKTFMGDSGAMFLGFTLAAIAVEGAFKSTVGLTFLVPVLVLGIPIFDLWFAVVRRLKNRRPVMTAPDREHVHHRMIDAGLEHRAAVIIFYCVTLALGVISLILIRAWGRALFLVAGIAALVPALILCGRFMKGRAG
ncbi:MAG: MraY family glycosyltransferase [bacterium]